MSFSEVIVFLCLMAYQLKENLMLDQKLTEEQEAQWLQQPDLWVRALLEHIMPHFGLDVKLDPAENTLNLITNTMPSDILLGGAV